MEYPYFGIKMATTEGGAGEDTTAELTISGWGDGEGNDTQRFIHLVH